ncbi:MAG TPA: PDZ domain-containing protein [Fimbriiglobus sp.]|nr:PDZ domain-containing protein [Fimbriiglobus sp.]
MRSLVLLLLLAAPVAAAGPDPTDTRLLTMPAVGPKGIAFVYAEDLWVADLDGKNPRRLTTDVGVESNPVFSPDGETIAFGAQYEGNTDVYTIPVRGGSPTRLTWHPGPDTPRAFTPDGQKILFSSPRNVYSTRHQQLFTVSLKGGMPDQLPIPWGFEATYSPDGEYIAYTPVRDVTAQWKHYRGGTHGRIWVYRIKDHQVVEVPQPKGRCNDFDPQWVGDTVYFRSDRAGEHNLFAYDPGSKEVKQVTQFTDFPVIDLNAGGGKLIFEQAGYLHLLTPGESQPQRLQIGIATDAPEARPRYAKGAKYVRGASVSPSGARVAVEFRGEIVTVPAEKGDPRNLTASPGVHDREPSWSPDGKTIAYFSDEGGEYQLVLEPQSGKGETKKVKLDGSGFYSSAVWSRDSTKIAYRDNSQTLYVLDMASGKSSKVVEPKYGRPRGLSLASWSPDSKWLAYTNDTPAQIARVYVYSVEAGKSFPLTDGQSEAADPRFDASGKYLYFLGSNDTGMSKHGFSQSSGDSRSPRWSLHLAVLAKDEPSPFLKESDEEKGPEAKKAPEPRIAGQGEDDEPKKDEPKARGGRKGEKEKPFKIDLEGIDQRILSFPLPSGSYGGLEAGSAGQVFYLARSEGGEERGRGAGPRGAALHRYDMERKRDTVVQPSVTAYELTPDGRKMLYSTGGDNWFVGSTSGGGGGGGAAPTPMMSGGGRGRRPGGGDAPSAAPSSSADGGDQRLNLDAIEVRVDPRLEWQQIFDEAWRINRDFFYDPNMHGADWPAVKKKYEAFLPHVTHGGDLYRVIGWMLSELAVGHSRYTPGERVHERKTVPGGLLGADYEVADGRYRIKKVYGGLNWTPTLRSPLTAPGVNVKEGEYLLAVQGQELKPPTNIHSLFENTAGKLIEITVGPTADGKDSRTVTVEPIASELALRNMDWVEGNRRKVEKATDGKVGYVYVPDTAGQGLAYFKRYFFPQVDRDALIIDERFNSGGQIADYYIDLLRRPFASYWAPRHGAEWRSPSAAVFGPKVMIIDEGAGSGGDMLPWMFRKFKVGPLVGKRTWGGLVGISGYPVLMDGGSVTAPSFAIWTPEDGFTVENEGVPPDHDVTMWPADVIAGKDPQLEKAIELALAALKEQPPKEDKRPAYPKRAGK